MFSIVGQRVFPFLQELGQEESTFAKHMKKARFTIPTAALLSKVVDQLDNIPMQNRDTNGDIYNRCLVTQNCWNERTIKNPTSYHPING